MVPKFSRLQGPTRFPAPRRPFFFCARANDRAGCETFCCNAVHEPNGFSSAGAAVGFFSSAGVVAAGFCGGVAGVAEFVGVGAAEFAGAAAPNGFELSAAPNGFSPPCAGALGFAAGSVGFAFGGVTPGSLPAGSFSFVGGGGGAGP